MQSRAYDTGSPANGGEQGEHDEPSGAFGLLSMSSHLDLISSQGCLSRDQVQASERPQIYH